jgi:hypothetical protein
MTRSSQQPRDPEPHRSKITRALTSWLIDHLTTGN